MPEVWEQRPASTMNADMSTSGLQTGLPSLGNAEGDFGAYTLLLSLRQLAKSLTPIPGRKSLILFTAGFELNPERFSELTATIDACNKANVAVYPLDVRGLVTPMSQMLRDGTQQTWASARDLGSDRNAARSSSLRTRNGARCDNAITRRLDFNSLRIIPRLPRSLPSRNTVAVVAAAGGGGRHGGGAGGGTGGGTVAGLAAAQAAERAAARRRYVAAEPAAERAAGREAARAVAAGQPVGSPYSNSPYNQARQIVPQFPPSASTNQQVMYALATGTGGFPILNTNDLMSGLEKIAREQSQYYLLGYAPAESPAGSCHTLKVKVERGGTNVRARSGFCNIVSTDLLAGKPIEKEMESRASASGAAAGNCGGGKPGRHGWRRLAGSAIFLHRAERSACAPGGGSPHRVN